MFFFFFFLIVMFLVYTVYKRMKIVNIVKMTVCSFSRENEEMKGKNQRAGTKENRETGTR